MNKRHLLVVIILSLLTFSCGGGSGSVKNQMSTQKEYDAFVLKRLGGLWKGSIKSYIDGTNILQCEWDVVLHLTDTIIPDSQNNIFSSSHFLGNTSAELIYTNGEGSDQCISDNFDFDWTSTLCITDSKLALFDYGFSCIIEIDRSDNEYVYLFDHETLEYLLDGSRLSLNKLRIYIERVNVDDPTLNLTRK